MHIAVCDDNVADRKQLERLLKRESDRRIASSGVLYVDSFGNEAALFSSPIQYDAFFVDMCKGTFTGTDVVNGLTAAGSNSPVIMCCSDIDYRTCSLPERAIYLNKPIVKEELSAVIDRAIAIRRAIAPTIELREQTDTYYVEEAEILYAVEDGRNLIVTLASGKKVAMGTTAMNFFAQVESRPAFLAPSLKVVINGRHIREFGFHKIIMTDGTCFKTTGKIIEYARQVQEGRI